MGDAQGVGIKPRIIAAEPQIPVTPGWPKRLYASEVHLDGQGCATFSAWPVI
jgi:hypothetical protein